MEAMEDAGKNPRAGSKLKEWMDAAGFSRTEMEVIKLPTCGWAASRCQGPLTFRCQVLTRGAQTRRTSTLVAPTRRTSKDCCPRLRSTRSQPFKGEAMPRPIFSSFPLGFPPSCCMELIPEVRMPINDFHVLVAQARHEATSIGLKVSRPTHLEGDGRSVSPQANVRMLEFKPYFVA